MESIWSLNNQIKRRSPLTENLHTEVAVIGAGLAGILTAYFLGKAGIECIVLEAAQIGSGQTKNTTAKITSQHCLQYHRMLEHFGQEKARQYADANQRAISEYFRIAKEEDISCMLEEKPAFLYSKKCPENLERELTAAKKLGIDAQLTSSSALPIGEVSALRFNGQAQFDPLKFLGALSEKVTVYEDTRATDVEEQVIRAGSATVDAENIVIATHFPFINAPGYYFIRMYQDRSYVIALENAPQIGGMYLGIDDDGLSFRNSGQYLFIGGGNHRTGENTQGGKYELLRKFAREHYPQCKEAAHWSAQDCMPVDGVPYIGQYSASTPHLFVATGFQKWGMTSSMVSAIVISDLIAGKDHPYPIFSPQRFNVSASAKTLLENGLEAVKGLATEAFSMPSEQSERLPIGHGGVVEHNGRKMGVYKDEEGQVHAVSTVCPHLGCQLAWNPDELSWDCPCHGSRFDYKGVLIDNPAMKGLREQDNR